MIDKLKPCPFCGARVRSHTIGDIQYVACDNLQCSFTERLTVNEWNDRPAELRLVKKAKRYKKAMKAALAQVREMRDQTTSIMLSQRSCAHKSITSDTSGTRCNDCGMKFGGNTTYGQDGDA